MVSSQERWLGAGRRLGLAAGFGLMAAGAVLAQTSPSSLGTLRAEAIATGLSHPWALGFLPDGRMLVTERGGQLRVVTAEGAVSPPLAGLPRVVAASQGGLLDVAVAPDFETSGRIYLSYSEPPEGAGLQRGTGTAVMAATLVLEGDSGALQDQSVIFRMNRFTVTNRHFGSRIAIGTDGTLFVTLGDRGDMDRAQDPRDLAGAVVRINPDGSVPEDNPHVEGWASPLWSIGHRNPQGAVVRPADGELFTVEHGARGGDELNNPQPGGNYGWPIITYGIDYTGLPIGVGTTREGLEQPLHYWDPSISPSGLALVSGDLFSEWEGDLIAGGLSGQLMVRLDLEGMQVLGEERLFEGVLGRVRDVRLGPDGAIYALTDADPGTLYRIAPER